MSRTILKFAFVLGLFVLALPPLVPFAAAQTLPGALNLEGVWELVEGGQRQDPAHPLIHIAHHIDDTVTAEFLTGAHCYKGEERIYAFVGKLVRQPTIIPSGQLSSDDMWVCSGSPSIVDKCGMSSKYQTSFTNASVQPDLIQGKRFRKITDNCKTTTEAQPSGDFELRRLLPCELEERKVAKSEQDLRDLLMSDLNARPVFLAAITAAQQRYGETFNGRPTNIIVYPYSSVLGEWESDPELVEEYFETHPEVLGSQEWANAKAMLQEMATAGIPLQEVVPMIEYIQRIERTARDGAQELQRLKNAKEALERCRGVQQ